MEQVVVEKRGCWNTHHWSQRVLSLSTVLGVATLSQRGHVEDGRPKCIRVSSVVMWPHYGKKHTHGDFNAMEAQLTLRVKGFAVRLGERVVNRAGGPQRVLHYTQRNCGSDARVWMLRFATFADLERTVHLFQAITIHPRVTTIAEGSQPTENGCGTAECTDCAEAAAAATAAAAAVEEEEDGEAAGETTVPPTPAATAATTTKATVEESASAVSAAVKRHRDDAPLSDDLVMTGVTASSVMDGDVARDLEAIRYQWAQTHPTAANTVAV